TKIYEYLPIFSKNPSIIHQLPTFKQPLHSFGEVIVLLHHIEPTIPIRTWVNEWKCSNQIKREAIELENALTYYEKYGLDQWLVYQLSDSYYEGFLRLLN